MPKKMTKEELAFGREVGRRIQLMREGMSQQDLAEQVDLTRQALAQIENGTTRLTLWRAHQIAEVLEIEVHELLPRPELPRVVGDTAEAKQREAEAMMSWVLGKPRRA